MKRLVSILLVAIMTLGMVTTIGAVEPQEDLLRQYGITVQGENAVVPRRIVEIMRDTACEKGQYIALLEQDADSFVFTPEDIVMYVLNSREEADRREWLVTRRGLEVLAIYDDGVLEVKSQYSVLPLERLGDTYTEVATDNFFYFDGGVQSVLKLTSTYQSGNDGRGNFQDNIKNVTENIPVQSATTLWKPAQIISSSLTSGGKVYGQKSWAQWSALCEHGKTDVTKVVKTYSR